MRKFGDWAPFVAFFSVTIVGHGAFALLAACSSTAQHHAEAESAYGAELQACIANSSNRVESDVCADKVRAKWALKDGGK